LEFLAPASTTVRVVRIVGCGVISEVVARNLIERFSNKTGQCRVAASESAP
jgi:hypothetical protein